MVTTTEIAPSPTLAQFIRCYSYIEFDTKGLDFIRPTNAKHEIAMTFSFKSTPNRFIDGELAQSFENTFGGLVGLFTNNNGDMVFNGHYTFFEIMFRPTGINKIFNLLPAEINNQMVFAEEIFDSGVKIFYEQLCYATSLQEKCFLADKYLLSFLNRQKSIIYKDAITVISNQIHKKGGILNIDKLAYHANMSTRTFERNFLQKVGLPPKLFCNIARFNHALELKFKNYKMDWTAIASNCGYYDQMHLIKDFKRFAGYTPTIVQKESHLNKMSYTNRVEA